MQFPITVLHELAKTLRGRDYAEAYEGISAYSEALMAQHVLGNFLISEETFNILNRFAVENFMPLPYNYHRLCTGKNVFQFENLPALTVSNQFSFGLLNFPMPQRDNWMIVATGEDGKLYALAHADIHFFEAGELIKEVTIEQARTRVGHVHIGNDIVTWEILNWAAAAVIFGNVCPLNIEFVRCEANHEDEGETDDGPISEDPDDAGETAVGNMILETLRDCESTFVDDAIFEVLGIKVPSEVTPVSVAKLLERLIVVENDTVEVEVDEEQMEINAKLLKALNFDAMAADVKALAKSKRTAANIRKIIAHHTVVEK
ncbi:hypothetical protein pEaSNUABM29_00233 [Erwinia phage pEa_SNUABM_29]|nr:hypothetical protein pEaSNUABM29_00233 [Erwinia phage pEa_SNUABM_29]